MVSFSFGTDPELMLWRDGIHRSAIGVVPGSKCNRFYWNGHGFFYDNVMAECAIKPSYTKEEALHNIQEALTKYAALVAPHILLTQAAQEYVESELCHPEAMEAGCKVETCAYLCSDIRPPDEIFFASNLRSAGGHVHIGSPIALDDNGRYTLVRLLDLFVGVPSIFIDKDKTSKVRKSLYGQAGRHRGPKYGVEYRSIGNFWLSSPKLVSLIYDLCGHTIDFIESGRDSELWFIDQEAIDNDDNWDDPEWDVSHAHKCHAYNSNNIQTAINKMDKRLGKHFLTLLSNYVPFKLYNRILEATNYKQLNMYEEWKIS